MVPSAWFWLYRHKSSSLWFSMEVKQEDWPWIFAKGLKASLVVSSLETHAVLAVSGPQEQHQNRSDDHGRQRERFRTQQTHVDEVSRERSLWNWQAL